MKEYNSPIIWMDTDCMLRRNINGFINKSLKHDFAVNLRKGIKDPKRHLLSAVFVVNNTEKGKKMLELMPEIYLEVFNDVGWWADPLTINLARIRSKVDTWSFDFQKYADNSFDKKSDIWHAKSSGVTKDIWIKETKRFLERYELRG
jgi:hypothetical protein